MSADQNLKISIVKSIQFTKALDKLQKNDLIIVEDNIEKIIENPSIGRRGKGDFRHLRVHDFCMNKRQVSLVYIKADQRLNLCLLH